MEKKVLPKLSIAELKKIYDFDYIREHFYDNNCTLDDLRGDIINCYENNLDITQLSAEGPNTTRVTNWFVKKTQHKATSIRAKMSPARAIMDDDALCQILNRIQSHPHFFSVKETTMEQLKQRGMLEFLDIDTDEMEDEPKKESIIQVQQEVRDTINKADLQEVRRALSHIPSFHKVSQFPNHVAQRIYEMYAPKQGGVILDSSCVDEDTEYFNGAEWKKIKDYTDGECVLQYELGHTCSLVKPIRYLHYKDKSKPFYHFTSYNTDQMLTGDHNVVSVDRINGTSRLDYSTIYKTPVEEFIKSKYPLDRTRIPTTVGGFSSTPISQGWTLSEDELRFLIACQADASITNPYYTTSDKHYFKTNPVYKKGTKRIYESFAKFSKPHKIKRFRILLENLNIPYKLSTYTYQSPKHKDQTVFTFRAPDFLYDVFNETKDFPQDWLYIMPSDMRDIFIDEIFKWDATAGNTYINTNKHNAEFVYTLLLTSDLMPKISVEDRRSVKGREHYKPCYYVSVQQTKSCSLFNKKSYSLVYKEDKYCFTVPSGMLILRRNGIPFITGNCGWGNRMMAAMCSKYHYKYLGTDPNSEMHPNYYGLAELIWDTLYKNNGLTMNKKFPEDFIDIRDQGSEFDIPEWHNMSGYQVHDTPEGTILENKFTGEHTTLPDKLEVKEYSDHGFTHPNPETGKGVCDTGKLNTTGAKLPPIYQTHDPEIFNSGIGDLSFTSPPYFFLECYTEDSQNGDLSTGQSAGKGDNYLRWVKEFMYPTVINHFNFLKPGGYYIYNLKDLPKDNLYLYSDWLSVCLDVGFELVEQPVMVLKARRQFGKKADGSDKIDFNGGTERVAVLRKPLTPDANTFNPQDKELMLHIQQYFLYPIIKACRPEQLESKLPQPVINYLEKKFEGKRYRFMKKKKS